MGNPHHNCKKEVPQEIHMKYWGNCSKECEAKAEPNLIVSEIIPKIDEED